MSQVHVDVARTLINSEPKMQWPHNMGQPPALSVAPTLEVPSAVGRIHHQAVMINEHLQALFKQLEPVVTPEETKIGIEKPDSPYSTQLAKSLWQISTELDRVLYQLNSIQSRIQL